MMTLHVLMALCATTLLVFASEVVHAAASVNGFRSSHRPTTTPTSTWTAIARYATQFARTEVHVLEKCCPHVSRFAVRDYPSVLEDDGWMPSLTFHAFQYHRQLPNCWQIVDTNASTGSQRWQRIHRGSTTTHPSTSNAFCLPTDNVLPDTGVSVFYVASADTHASFVSQPIRTASQAFFDAFTLAGWNASTPRFHKIYPLAYYYWKPLMPMPQRLISDIRLHATEAEAHAPPTCSDGYTIVPGNLNDNFVGDPVVYFCVQYSYSAVVDPRFNLSAQPNHNRTFVTDIAIEKTTREQISQRRREPEYAQRVGRACKPPRESITTQLDFWNRRDDAQRIQQLDALNATLAQLRLPATYTVVTGAGQRLTFCMVKQPLADASGRYRAASAFVDRLFLNLSQIVRRKRLGVVYNVDVPEAAKQSPRGRLHYADEDAKDEAEDDRAFDEL